MKTLTTSLLDKMLAHADLLMANEQWTTEAINGFKSDPMIRMLYGACAEEIGNVHEELFHVKERLIKDTIEKLLPEEFHIPTPAHAIVTALPIEKVKEGKIGIDSQIIIKKQENEEKDFVFTPAGYFSLSQAEVQYMVFRDSMYVIEKESKQKVLSGDPACKFQDDVLWIGIKDLDKVQTRDKLTFFFNLPQTGRDPHSFFTALKYVRCFAGDQPLVVSTGLTSDEAEMKKRMLQQRKSTGNRQAPDNKALTEDTDYRERIIREPDFMIYKLMQNVRDWYHKQFLTIYDIPVKPSSASEMPEDFLRLFSSKDLDTIKGNIFWLRLSFGNLLDEKWISQLFCSMNSFPVLNLKLERNDYNVDSDSINIFPVYTEDIFLYLRSVIGKITNRDSESEYRLMETDPSQTVSLDGDAIFREGGLGRQDPRKLKHMLNMLSNLLKEETILLTKDGTRDDLKKLGHLTTALSEFEISINDDPLHKSKHTGSIIVKPYKYNNKIFINFWTTAAEEANQIRPGKGEDRERQCEVFYGPEIKQESVRLITTTQGGKRKPSDEEHLDTVRKLILTRGRIVTIEDIRAFCYEHFTSYKIAVDVKKSVGQSSTPGQGLVRTIEVSVRFLEKPVPGESMMALLKEELLLKLEQNSRNIMPYVITIS